MTQTKAAERSGISLNTAKKYEQLALLPTVIQNKLPVIEQTHSFVKHWDEITSMLIDSPALMAKTILDYL